MSDLRNRTCRSIVQRGEHPDIRASLDSFLAGYLLSAAEWRSPQEMREVIEGVILARRELTGADT